MSALERITARRVWFVPSVMVYGSPDSTGFGALLSETVGDQRIVYYQTVEIGDDRQHVRYDSLVDHRGNRLPTRIESPRVIPRARSEYAVFVTAPESEESFVIARASTSPGAVVADLLIVELGS